MIEEYRFDGSNKLSIKEMPTCAEPSARKKDIIKRTEENMLQCALLQEKLYAEGKEALLLPSRRGTPPVRTA